MIRVQLHLMTVVSPKAHTLGGNTYKPTTSLVTISTWSHRSTITSDYTPTPTWTEAHWSYQAPHPLHTPVTHSCRCTRSFTLKQHQLQHTLTESQTTRGMPTLGHHMHYMFL